MTSSIFVVVPFTRQGNLIGAAEPILIEHPKHGEQIANRVASQAPGVAVLRRDIDPETGDEADTLIASAGAVPAGYPHAEARAVRLN